VALQPGQTLGNYQILSRIGSGGMGEVYLATHPLIGKKVALKAIHGDLSLNKEVVARFVNEARAVSSIGSDHIVEIHDFGQTPEGAHFFIMEYLEGRTLADTLATHGRLPVERALHIAAQIASGLGAAHRQQIIHRDLKPDNIMLVEKLGDRDFVKILDFGLAKMLADNQQLTSVGVVLGTPEYMSPEAAESKRELDGRADLYSLGVLLFQMLTGRLPFQAERMGEVLVQQVCRAPPVPRAFNPEIPPAVEQIVLRCLAKKPEARFQTMEELRAALLDPDAYLAGTPPVVASDGATGAMRANPPALAAPKTASNRTMAIATPAGFVGRRRSKRPLIFVVSVIMSAGIGSAIALVHPADLQRGHEVGERTGGAQARPAAPEPGAVPDKPAKSSRAAPADAGTGAEPALDGAAGTAPAAVATLQIDSSPQGAAVFIDGERAGKTPLSLQLPADGRELEISLRRKGRRSASRTIRMDGNHKLAVPLHKRKEPVVHGDNTMAPSL
jgi:serine/threonine-protein kinase